MVEQTAGATIPTERMADCIAVVTGAPNVGITAADIGEIAVQTGGLFNFLLRVQTGKGLFYFKQYLDGVPNATFTPPEIPAARRSELAFQVQHQAAQAAARHGDLVPRIVHYDRERCAFLMEPAHGSRLLIELLSSGSIPEVAVTKLPAVLGELHQTTYGAHRPDSLYGNTEFRDFKLRLQYDGVAERLDPAQSQTVLQCKRDYQRRQVCVTHGDPNSRNIVVGEQTMGLFDFEQSHLGAPAYDLAYILSEYVIATEHFGRRPEHRAAIARFLDSYFEVFSAEDRKAVETETTTHLAIQMLYRFWGPSRASWTFYLREADAERVIGFARQMLTDAPLPVSAIVTH